MPASFLPRIVRIVDWDEVSESATVDGGSRVIDPDLRRGEGTRFNVYRAMLCIARTMHSIRCPSNSTLSDL